LLFVFPKAGAMGFPGFFPKLKLRGRGSPGVEGAPALFYLFFPKLELRSSQVRADSLHSFKSDLDPVKIQRCGSFKTGIASYDDPGIPIRTGRESKRGIVTTIDEGILKLIRSIGHIADVHHVDAFLCLVSLVKIHPIKGLISYFYKGFEIQGTCFEVHTRRRASSYPK